MIHHMIHHLSSWCTLTEQSYGTVSIKKKKKKKEFDSTQRRCGGGGGMVLISYRIMFTGRGW